MNQIQFDSVHANHFKSGAVRCSTASTCGMRGVGNELLFLEHWGFTPLGSAIIDHTGISLRRQNCGGRSMRRWQSLLWVPRIMETLTNDAGFHHSRIEIYHCTSILKGHNKVVRTNCYYHMSQLPCFFVQYDWVFVRCEVMILQMIHYVPNIKYFLRTKTKTSTISSRSWPWHSKFADSVLNDIVHCQVWNCRDKQKFPKPEISIIMISGWKSDLFGPNNLLFVFPESDDGWLYYETSSTIIFVSL